MSETISAQQLPPRISNSIWIPVAILGSLLLISLVLQLSMAWVSYKRMVPVSEHAQHMEELQNVLSSVGKILSNKMPAESKLSPEIRQTLQQSLQKLKDNNNYILDTTPKSLNQASDILDDTESHPRDILSKVVEVLRNSYQEEAKEQRVLTRSIHEAAFFEVQVGTFTLIILPIGLILLLFLIRKRMLKPLQEMESMMSLLGNKQYQRIPSENFATILQPLANNYNDMVVRLSELEAEHLQHETNLEEQVDKAARTLIEQQRTLANTERLATLGEVMAKLAHELRNPLAGVKMACTNLQSDLADTNQLEHNQKRIAMISNEVDRMINLLNGLLNQAQHDPEQLTEINIKNTIDDLMDLAGYQIPKSINLLHECDAEINCRLPASQFRQVLLNLIINAQQAIGDKQGIVKLLSYMEEDSLIIKICDDGPGFPPEILEEGIRAFSTQREGGTGLGLSIVQRFVRNQGGTLELTNQKVGACVTLKLPCSLNQTQTH